VDDRYPVDPAADPGRSPICERFLLKLAKTRDKKKRLGILKACAKVRAPWVEELFWESLGDSCEDIRGFILKELGRRPALDLSWALGRLARPPWYAKSAVLKLLGVHRVKEAIGEIRRAIDDSANVEIRRAAAEALGEIGGKEALRLLVRLKKDPNLYVRQAAEEAIQKASDLRFV
jgi:HEAT repeat protein